MQPPAFEQSADRLNDPAPGVRYATVTQLGRYGSREALGLLAKALADEAVEVRREAARWLAFWKAREYLPALLQVLGDRDTQVRREAAKTLESLGEWPQLPAGLAALGDSDEEVRLAAVNFLAKLKAVEATSALVPRLLSDPSAKIRAAAAAALAQSGDPQAAPALLQALKDPDSTVQLEAIRGLGRLPYPYPAAAPILAQILLKGANGELREAAALSLRVYPDKASLTALQKTGQDRDKKLAAVATLALVPLAPTPANITAMQAVVAGPDWKIRLKAAQTLAEMRDPQTGPLLLQRLFTETENQVKKALITAVAALPPAPYLTEALLQLFYQQPPWQPQLLAPLLRSGDPRVGPVIGQALNAELAAGLLPGRDLPPDIMNRPDGPAQLLDRLGRITIYAHNLQVGPLSRWLAEQVNETSGWIFYQLLSAPDPLPRYFALKILAERPVINVSEGIGGLLNRETIPLIKQAAGQLLVGLALDKGWREAAPPLVNLLKSEVVEIIRPQLGPSAFANSLEQKLARRRWLETPLGELVARRVTADNQWFFEGLLRETEPALRAFALQALLAKPVCRPAETLSALLNDPIALLRQMTIEALSQLGITAAGAAVLGVFENDQEIAVKTAAAQSLGRFREERAVPALTRALEHNLQIGITSPDGLFDRLDLIGALCTSLGQIGTPAAQAALTRALADPANHGNRIHYELVVGLGQLENPEPAALAILVEQLQKASSPTVRYYAAESLGKIGNASVIAALETTCQHDKGSFGDDENISWVHQAAGLALERIRGRYQPVAQALGGANFSK